MVSSARFNKLLLIASSLAHIALILICFLISQRKDLQIFGQESMLDAVIGGIATSASVLIIFNVLL